MSPTQVPRHVVLPASDPHLDIGFDGYPNLVTKVGTRALRHVMVLPADRSRDGLVELATRQARANGLPTALVLGPTDAVEVTTEEPAGLSTILSSGRVPQIDRLMPPERFRPTRELTRRRADLRAWVAEDRLVERNFNYWGANPVPRVATQEERRANRPRRDNPHPGIVHCPACGDLRGEALAFRYAARTKTGVVDVYCRCQNRNRCAACGEWLAPHRLDAHHWSADYEGPCYVQASVGLLHRCSRVSRELPADED